jgi:hypothetical protein
LATLISCQAYLKAPTLTNPKINQDIVPSPARPSFCTRSSLIGTLHPGSKPSVFGVDVKQDITFARGILAKAIPNMINIASVHLHMQKSDIAFVLRIVERYYPNIERLQLT